MLPQSPFLCTAEGAAQANQWIQHPNGWWAHPVIKHRDSSITNDKVRPVFFHLQIRFQSFDHQEDTEVHPWPALIYYQAPKHPWHQFYPVLRLDVQSTSPFYQDYSRFPHP